MGINDYGKQVSSQISNFLQSKPKIESHSTTKVKDLKKLEAVVDGKNLLSQAVQKCKAQFRKLIGENDQMGRRDYEEVNRTQEHLFRDKGTTVESQFGAFKECLKKKGEEYAPLKKELDSHVPLFKMVGPPAPKNEIDKAITNFDKTISHHIHILNEGAIQITKQMGLGNQGVTAKRNERPDTNEQPGAIDHSANARAQAMKAGVENLKPGESVLIDAQSWNLVGVEKKRIPGHAMVMRLTNNGDGSFKMEFANTGLGIQNEKFHPKSSTEPHKCQTIACIPNIPSEKLLNNNFFETYCSIANGEDIPANACLDETSKGKANKLLEPEENEYESIKNRIDALYICLETLGEAATMPEDSSYYSRPQIGGSCSVSGLWAISSIILPKESITEMAHDTKLKSLLRNYKLIENGYDQSSTRKIMVLDQVESLKHIYKGDEEAIKIFNKIEEKIKADLHMERVESKVKKGRIALKLEATDTPNEFSIAPIRGKLTQQKGKLKLDVEWKSAGTEIRYNVVGNPPDLQGKTRTDSMFLLYFAIANGDQQACEKYIQDVLNQPPDNSSPEKNAEINECLIGLINDLSEANTRSEIAKKCFLEGLIGLNVSGSNSKYIAMDVEAHLRPDNIWVKGINDLKAKHGEMQKQKIEEVVRKHAALKDLADQGDVESQFEFGNNLWMKRGFIEAVKYLQMAADQGHVDAQYKMVLAFNRNQPELEDVIDLETAIKYARLAADQGHEQAKNELDRLLLKRDGQ